MEGHEPALLIIKTVDEEVTLDNILNIGVHWIMFADMLCLTLDFYLKKFSNYKHYLYILYVFELLVFVISQVFGAFLSTDLIERKKHDSEGLTYFGTGECFVCTVSHLKKKTRPYLF